MAFEGPKHTFLFVLLTALSLSVGWGIRGNFGHENGAMIPGALAAMGAVLLAGREDWWRRIAYFAFFGALGWSFGGSISYMQVIGYTHSGHLASVLYGFACLFVIGFLWGAMGGAGTVLPACLSRERLTEFFVPLTVVFLAWLAQDFAVGHFESTRSDFRHQSPLYWYDTDWLGVLVALGAVLALAAVRRRLDAASGLILHMAVGWWIGFLVLVIGLGWRMTPPRGDDWAGCVGAVAGMWVYFQRHGLKAVTVASLISGFIGGLGFATADLIKLVAIKSGWQTNWHSVLEQTYGFINGLGIAAALLVLRNKLPRTNDEPRLARWTEVYSVAFVLVGITYLNLRRNPTTWVKAGTVSAAPLGLSAQTWFSLAYLLLAALVIVALIVHQRRPLPLLPATAAGRAQLIYLVFLWWVVIGNFELALASFTQERLVTEGMIHLNAVLCSALVLFALPVAIPAPSTTGFPARGFTSRLVALGILCSTLSIAADWVIVRAVWGDTFAGQASLHIRFGPGATATKEKPAAGKPHP